MANLKIELSKLESEACPGAIDVEKEKLLLINEKEEFLKELQFVTPRRRTQDELEHLEAERRRLEEDLLSVKTMPCHAVAERLKVQEKRRELVQKLEESTRLATLIHSQLKSLSASTLSVSSGSSLGSLASSRGSLNTSSRGSLNSLSSTDLYYSQQEPSVDLDYQYKLELLLQEKIAYIPSGPITTIHENEVVKSPTNLRYNDSSDSPASGHMIKSTEPSKSVTSLSSRSSLSSLSPPGSPLVLEGSFLQSTQDSSLHDIATDFADCEIIDDFKGLGLYKNQIVLNSEPGVSQFIPIEKESTECLEGPTPTFQEDVDIQGTESGHLLEEKVVCVSAAVSDESVAGDSGVYEASLKRYFRVVLLPSSLDSSCLFRTKLHSATDCIVFNEIFRADVPHTTLQQKTLRVDICTVGKTQQEECLAGTQISLADILLSDTFSTHWYNLLPCKKICHQKNKQQNKHSLLKPPEQHASSIELDAVSALLERTSAELEAVEQQLAQEEQDRHMAAGEDWLEIVEESAGELSQKEDEEEDILVNLVEDGELSDDNFLHQEDEIDIGESAILNSNPAANVPLLVDKETNTEEDTLQENVAVRPKDRSNLNSRQRSFVRNSMIVRSQTFSPGERSQYICRLNRSDSDSSTLAKKSPFVRNATERRSLRVKRTICQPMVRRVTQDHPTRTSLDLELDLQASRTRQSRLDDELQALRELKRRLEEIKAKGETELSQCILEDERFQKLLKQAEKQAEQTKEQQKQGLRAEKLMRKASKDVFRLREQSQKVPLQVQSFRKQDESLSYVAHSSCGIPRFHPGLLRTALTESIPVKREWGSLYTSDLRVPLSDILVWAFRYQMLVRRMRADGGGGGGGNVMLNIPENHTGQVCTAAEEEGRAVTDEWH
ncbi:WWC2 protein, partial [Polypterus senegalus]|nr:WWC2 protein [Polypterus senegalus]